MPAGVRRRRVRGAGLAAAAAGLVLALSGCSPSGGAGPSTNFLRIGTIAIVNTLNPWVTTDQLSLDIQTDIYPKLIQYSLKTLTPEPGYATSWRTSQDGRVITFTLHRHARWSDGRPLTARDVAWTINTMVKFRNGSTAAWASAVAGVSQATAVNPWTVAITYKRPVSEALS